MMKKYLFMRLKNFYLILESKYGDDVFARVGGLSLIKQKFDKKTTSFHSPPANRGVYAFPIKSIDFFLAAHRLAENSYKKFKYSGEIWHHLEHLVKPNEIISHNGSWVLTEFQVWLKAYEKESLKLRMKDNDGKINEPSKSGKFGIYSVDHLEVFIPHKIGGDRLTNFKGNYKIKNVKIKQKRLEDLNRINKILFDNKGKIIRPQKEDYDLKKGLLVDFQGQKLFVMWVKNKILYTYNFEDGKIKNQNYSNIDFGKGYRNFNENDSRKEWNEIFK